MPINLIPQSFLKKIKKVEKKQKLIIFLTKVSLIFGLFFLFVSFVPSLWFSLSSNVDDFSKAILKTAETKNDLTTTTQQDITRDLTWQPPVDPKLSRLTVLKIPKIGVNTVVNEKTYQNYEEALEKGVWRVPDFGTPVDRSKPTILAAHRFGYLKWSNLYRRQNSFYNLPKLKEGDLVEIIYKQRKFTFEIYSESRGDEITDYSADLILYTCESLNSKVRIFKYARLLQV